jgi:diacylglycerol kinase (ATP)
VPNLSGVSSQNADLILANPTAGGGLARAAMRRLHEFAKSRQWNVELRAAGSTEEFTHIAREEAQQGRTRIFALGGDGTFQVLLNSVAGISGVSIGVLPAGGGNDLASALGLPCDPVQAAEAILRSGEPDRLDAARVRTADGTERLYMGGGGVGLDAEAARFASGVYRRIRGRSRYLLSAVRALVKFRPLKVRVSFENSGQEAIEGAALVVGVLNTPSYGAGLRLAPEASLVDGKLDLVMLGDLSWFEVLRILPVLAASGEIRTKRIRRYLVTTARIETDRPCVFHADGEIIGQTPVEISIVPQAMPVWRAKGTAPRSQTP